ncbi:TonB-dependent receptor [Undibacterium sp. Di26W]|uniref:TonB-dependent receptor n=1 Tax=Undibacterium sp. Di26W TaxID=3413035 RepID=UPI003BF16760
MKNKQRDRSALSMLLLGAISINVQAADAPIPELPASQDKSETAQQEVVVTGTSGRKKKFETPYAISTISEAEIQRKDPKSTVDLLKSVPGIKVENSGGQGGGENVVIRGLPFSGFRLMDMLEDGLPLFESNFERQLQIDELYRVDLGTVGAEIVRGGTAPVYSNNASGGVVNFLSNFGTTEPDHAAKLTVGQHHQVRADLAMSGPVNDRLLYSFSGFLRQGDGLRDPGFSNADRGGQIKLGATYLLGGGDKLFVSLKHLDDRAIFYTSIPLTDTRNGNSLANQIDPHTGTLDSASFRQVRYRVLDGQGSSGYANRDLADGIHPKVTTLTAGVDFTLPGGWKLSDKARYTSGEVGFNALLNGAPSDAGALLQANLSTAQKAFAGTTSLRYLYAGSGQVFDPAATAGLTMTNTWSSTISTIRNAVNDLRASKSFALADLGTHDVALGLSLSRYSLEQQQIGNTILTNVKNNADLLDIQALNAASQPTGMVTENGFTTYGSGDLIGRVHGLASAVYAAENWHISKDWQVDIGVRHEVRQERGERGVIGKQALSSTGPLAAQSVTGLTGYVPYSVTQHGTAWTAGSLLQISEPLNAFVRYSSAYSLPRLSDYWANINNGVAGTLPNGQPVPVTPVRQAEVGLKLSQPQLQLVLIGFYSNFKNLNSSTYFADATGVLTNQPLLINTTTKGLELEGTWRPSSAFEVNGSVTLQQPDVNGGVTFTTLSANSLAGKQIPRVPRTMATLSPAWLFKFDDRSGRLYATFSAVGKSYQDFVNTSILPAYRTVDLGFQYRLTPGVSLQLTVSNLTNSAGLTEGNARAPSGNAFSVAEASTGRPIFGRSVAASIMVQW